MRMINAPLFAMIVDRGFHWQSVLRFIPFGRIHFDISIKDLSIVGLENRRDFQLVLRNLKKKREFAYLKRGLSPKWQTIKALSIPGLFGRKNIVAIILKVKWRRT